MCQGPFSTSSWACVSLVYCNYSRILAISNRLPSPYATAAFDLSPKIELATNKKRPQSSTKCDPFQAML
ncbi:hypothetical protein COCC4DRAFT_34002 [Bipolaris maydis ATCC 48331]|uniref:Uncharacterized protein n=2 Tax=Cochliobolus heterostrophus TaxID=5016 RepID=M2VBY8_COCH5|nr:uncharacterized protein COCC4DRAFT_34002 [Bipolaris maydis ATCC 48331]EMD97472.1 hypothetical protein COCHEDRAFT_1018945 [Bipolaris maydis C5]ENI01391.1 hypothetical protein COCC4DRAFT_34002 [Bipolaris maydis ATCC 48331]